MSNTSMGMLDMARAHFAELVGYLLLFGTPLGLLLGAFWAKKTAARSSTRPFSLSRALVAGGLAGIVGGWAFGQWMEKAHFFPLIAGLVGSASPSVGKSLHFLFAVVIGATFGLLFQRDVRGYGSSAGWGLAYGIFWWFLGPLTLKSLLQAQKPDWSLAHGQELFGSLIGHIVYCLIVGIIYAALDKLWVGFFIHSDPINRPPEAPGSRHLLSAGLAPTRRAPRVRVPPPRPSASRLDAPRSAPRRPPPAPPTPACHRRACAVVFRARPRRTTADSA